MMQYKMGIFEFIHGKCEAIKDTRKFVNNWIQTVRNPCSVCEADKSKCELYKELVAQGAFDEGDNQQ